MSQSSSEIFLSYLTVPYLRIPLVLNFFAKPEHISALGILDIQSIIDSVIFEPGQWHPPTEKILPSSIPANDRTFLATPLGLLCNELKMSPHASIKPLTDLLEYAIDLDPGCYTEETGFMILYVIRLIIRIEGFILFFIKYHQWDKNKVSKSRWEGFVRGLESTDEHIQLMIEKQNELRDIINEQIFPMLERWKEHAIKIDDMPTACILYAHLAYLFLHTTKEEFTPEIVITLISSQIFLNSHYQFHSENDTGKKVKRTSKGLQSIGLGIPDTEMFDLFQKQRGNILYFLMKDNDQRNQIMETVVKMVTLSSKTRIAAPISSSGLTRYWRNVDGFHNIGRFVPDLNPRTPEEQERIEKQRPFTRDQPGTKVETEINIQLGTFTLDNSPMERLDDRIYLLPDFKEVFGDSTHLACAVVKKTTKRNWVRIMGTRIDIQLWKPDERVPTVFNSFTRKYAPDSLNPSEQWISTIFEPFRAKFKLLASGEIYLPSQNYSTNDFFARLMGFELEYNVNTSEKIEKPTKQKLDYCYDCKTKFSITNKQKHCK